MHLQEIIKEQLRQIKVIIKVLLTPKDSLVRNLMKILIRKESYPKVNIYLASILNSMMRQRSISSFLKTFKIKICSSINHKDDNQK